MGELYGYFFMFWIKGFHVLNKIFFLFFFFGAEQERRGEETYVINRKLKSLLIPPRQRFVARITHLAERDRRK